MRKLFSFLLVCLAAVTVEAQQLLHDIKGTVIDKAGRQPLEFVNVQIAGTGQGGVTDSLGRFIIRRVEPGIYHFQASLVGYRTAVTPEYILSTKDLSLTIELEESQTELQGVVVTASPFRRDLESPVGLRVIGLQQIEKSPGANRDISRVVQSYPGVAFSPIGYRNDLIVRGGSPMENRFFIDGVEIPNINHFSTGGASGGPVGIINADFIREAGFYTGSFPASKGNALSSVLDFKLRDGDMEHNSIKATLGASEVALASDGHIGNKTSYLVSVRQSYLQLLFDVLGLPFLPKFTDAQFKLKTRFDRQNELTVLGLAGIDDMRLNTSLTGEDAEYLLSYLPKIEQETFTVGAVYKHYAGKHLQTLIISHNYLNNRNLKYRDNDNSSEDNLNLRLRTLEQETKLRAENATTLGAWKLQAGISLNYSHYTDNTFRRVYADEKEQVYDYRSSLRLFHWGIYGTAGYTSPDQAFTASVGIRADANNYSGQMKRLYKQLSPRLSLSYRLTDGLYLSGSTGLYCQLPPYTALGFQGNSGTYVNRELRYMRVHQSGVGLAWRKGNTWEVSLEGFWKRYGNIPLSVADGIPLLCKGNDYGVVGNEALVSAAQGRSYGLEALARWVIAGKLTLSASATYFKSEFRNSRQSPYIASAWDNRFICNATGTYSLPRHWSVGMRVSCIGGAPYTPYDVERSSLVTAWNSQGRPYYDYSRYNTGRLPAFGQLDVRVDKTFYLKRCMLGIYLDVQNITKSILRQPDILMSTGVIENPDAPLAEQRYRMKYIEQSSGTLLPTLGITFEY